jgi:NAD(P)-dependent dehydrogenase (short-subunit alcohol dehydrogenase family)
MALNPAITDWQGRRVWIVGASTGIGAALARRLLALGARVALSARKEAPLRELAEGHAGALVLPADVTQAATLVSAEAAVRAAWGGIDLVVVMAGTYSAMRAWELDTAAVASTFDTNVSGIYNVLAAVQPDMLARGAGGICIVSSVAGYRGLPNALAYGPSKAAAINLAEALFLDLRPRGIAVYLVNPGFVETPLTAGNEFKMPALISADEAAAHMLRGFARGDFEMHFPKRFTGWLKLMRLLPYRLYFAAVRRITGL